MDVALRLLAQSDGPGEILPATNEGLWGIVSIGLLLASILIPVLVVRYWIVTRRIAESAASEAAALREELGHRSVEGAES